MERDMNRRQAKKWRKRDHKIIFRRYVPPKDNWHVPKMPPRWRKIEKAWWKEARRKMKAFEEETGQDACLVPYGNDWMIVAVDMRRSGE